MITEIIRYQIPEQQHATFITAYKDAMSFVDKSGFALSWEILQQQTDKNLFQVIIRWKSKDEHLKGFRTSAEFEQFFLLVKPYYTSILEMQHYDQV